jgi:hypothetical protein
MLMRTILLSLAIGVATSTSFADPATLKRGDSASLVGRRVTVTRLDDLPYVESDYTKRFVFDRFDNPRLKELREKYKLDEVVAPGQDEFDRQILLLDWVNRQFKSFGRPTSKARGALDILAANEAGNTFFCAHYADTFVSAAASLGWVDRTLALRRPENVGSGSTEHSSTEIWSNQYRKWVMLDPTFAMYVEKDGVPLNAFEIRREWFYNDARDITFVLGKDRKRFKKSDMPVFRHRYAGFGDLVLDGGAVNPYAFIGYVPNTNLMDAGPDYGRMFITKDKLCDGTKWHQRVNPADPEHEPYFPIDQAALTVTAAGDELRVAVKTMTPNFKTFQSRADGQDWKDCGAAIAWRVHAGANTLEVRAVNQFGVAGAVSTVGVDVGK